MLRHHHAEWATGPLRVSLLFLAFQIRPKFSTVYAAHISSIAIWIASTPEMYRERNDILGPGTRLRN